MLNLIKKQDSDNLIDKIYLYAKDINETKDQFFIKKHEVAEIKHLNDAKAFMQYLTYMDHVNNNIDDYNPARKRQKLIV